MATGLNADALYSSWYNHVFQGEVLAANSKQDFATVFRQNDVEYLLLSSVWGTAVQRDMIASVSDEVASIAHYTVRKLSREVFYGAEKLQNAEIIDMAHWLLGQEEAIFDPASQSIVVTNSALAIQIIEIEPGHSYLQSAFARCQDMPGTGRLQVNWLNVDGEIIDTNIGFFECTPESKLYQNVANAPTDAVTAVVFLAAQSSVPISFQSMSFK